MAPFPVLVHPFESETPRTTAYESGNPKAKNAFVVIGGLGDGPHTILAARSLSKALEDAPDLDYSLFEVRMHSSFDCFGNSSLRKDVSDITNLVRYLRQIGREKIVLLGHSTGCQDLMLYNKLSGVADPVEGFILQGPVSDRECIRHVCVQPEEKSVYEEALKYARKMATAGRLQDWMPRNYVPETLRSTPFTVYRFLSLADIDGDDDFFSSDLSSRFAAEIWNSLTKPTLVLPSAEDEFVPKYVNKLALLKEWMDLSPLISPLSDVIPGADHAVENPEAQKWYSKSSWRGCGSHIPNALAGIPEKDWCQCEPRVMIGSKSYPSAARMQLPGMSFFKSLFGNSTSK
ncbi:hypothetical protein TD95_002445 [Thielaviopsis punctulata]|uniref:Uncharacterized protein n=1 Tax=Thielaviopsis punctulata TaxID=72032 RepID=A0A0F4ZAJ9_9PEZI|nr:hypothetical protein TD95_002445 [Thielaviopsis punctulata]